MEPARAPLIARLLQKSWDFRASDVFACLKLAGVAVAVAERSGTREELCVSLAHLGNAERLCGEFERAGLHLDRASSLCSSESAPSATLAEFWTSLYLDVQDFESATRTARRAIELRSGDSPGLCRSFTLLGLALGYGGDPVGAVKALRQAVTLALDQDSLLVCVQPLVRFLLEAERPGEALAVAQQCRHLLKTAPRLVRLRWSWHEALIHLALGACSAAIQTLAGLQVIFLESGMLQEAAHVAIDLALALLKDERAEKALEVIAGAEPVFQALGLRGSGFEFGSTAEASLREIRAALWKAQARPGLVRPAA